MKLESGDRIWIGSMFFRKLSDPNRILLQEIRVINGFEEYGDQYVLSSDEDLTVPYPQYPYSKRLWDQTIKSHITKIN